MGHRLTRNERSEVGTRMDSVWIWSQMWARLGLVSRGVGGGHWCSDVSADILQSGGDGSGATGGYGWGAWK